MKQPKLLSDYGVQLTRATLSTEIRHLSKRSKIVHGDLVVINSYDGNFCYQGFDRAGVPIVGVVSTDIDSRRRPLFDCIVDWGGEQSEKLYRIDYDLVKLSDIVGQTINGFTE